MRDEKWSMLFYFCLIIEKPFQIHFWSFKDHLWPKYHCVVLFFTIETNDKTHKAEPKSHLSCNAKCREIPENRQVRKVGHQRYAKCINKVMSVKNTTTHK